MARSIHDRLTAAAARLDEVGDHDSASAVRSVAVPGGWRLLQQSGGAWLEKSTLTLTTTVDVKHALAAASEDFGVVLSHVAEEGFQKVLDGEWVPPRTGRSSGTRAVVNVKVTDALRRQVREMLPRLSEEAGYRVTESSIGLWWLCEELGVDRGMGLVSPYVMPAPLADHFAAAAEEMGTSLEQIVDERVRDLLDGSWEMSGPPRAVRGAWDDAPRKKLSLRVDDRVRDALNQVASQLSEKFNKRVYPGSIVRAILTDRLGEPAE